MASACTQEIPNMKMKKHKRSPEAEPSLLEVIVIVSGSLLGLLFYGVVAEISKQTKAQLKYTSNLHEKIKSLESDIERKDSLLKSALETLMDNEYVVDLGVIADIEDELKQR